MTVELNIFVFKMSHSDVLSSNNKYYFIGFRESYYLYIHTILILFFTELLSGRCLQKCISSNLLLLSKK